MPDIDVGALSLSTPPTSAPRTTYRPAVQVRNNGIAAAVASGSLSIFDLATGLKVSDLALGPKTINPGVTASVLALLTWTPAAGDVGKTFMFFGFVSCPGDMVAANNYLAPVYVTITGETPPTPPVANHAQQHEDGGGDELNVTGLSGALGEPQTPTDHAVAHQSDGADQLDVSGLPGLLAEPQPPAVHSNTAHTVPFCALEDAAALVGAHNASPAAHETLLEGVERTANKGRIDGYPELNHSGLVPQDQLGSGAKPYDEPKFLRNDQSWVPAPSLGIHGSELHNSYPPFPLFPMLRCAEGTAATTVRSDHIHQVSGGFASTEELLGLSGGAGVPVLSGRVVRLLLGPPCVLSGRVFGCATADSPSDGQLRCDVLAAAPEAPPVTLGYILVPVPYEHGVPVADCAFDFSISIVRLPNSLVDSIRLCATINVPATRPTSVVYLRTLTFTNSLWPGADFDLVVVLTGSNLITGSLCIGGILSHDRIWYEPP